MDTEQEVVWRPRDGQPRVVRFVRFVSWSGAPTWAQIAVRNRLGVVWHLTVGAAQLTVVVVPRDASRRCPACGSRAWEFGYAPAGDGDVEPWGRCRGCGEH